MEINYFPEGDVLNATLNDIRPSYGKWTDFGSVDYAEDGVICRVSFIQASLGVNVEAAPEEVREEVTQFLKDNDLLPIPVEEWSQTARK